MGKMIVSRRSGASGKLRNSELLKVSVTDSAGELLAENANACGWEDFLFHLGPVTPRLRLHQADRDLRAAGTAVFTVDGSVVDAAWIKSFLLVED